MAKRDELFPSKFLRAADLSGKPKTLTISKATRETLKNGGDEQSKLVVYFKGAKKGLPLNITNFDTIMGVTGEADSDDWVGHRIEVYPTTTEMRGKTVDCIRIRQPAQGELPTKQQKSKPSASDEMDDEIPW
jgi:hypothetical protein